MQTIAFLWKKNQFLMYFTIILFIACMANRPPSLVRGREELMEGDCEQGGGALGFNFYCCVVFLRRPTVLFSALMTCRLGWQTTARSDTSTCNLDGRAHRQKEHVGFLPGPTFRLRLELFESCGTRSVVQNSNCQKGIPNDDLVRTEPYVQFLLEPRRALFPM